MAAWETKPLAEVCTIKPPKAEARAKLAGSEEVSFVPMEDLGIGVKHVVPTRTRKLEEVAGSYTYFADGDVLLAKITPCFENGKLGVARGLVNGVGFGSSEYVVLRPGPELDAEFLYYFLARPSFREIGARSMTGAVGHKRITREFVEGSLIPMPTLAEQRRLVDLLDATFEGISVLQNNAEACLLRAEELGRALEEACFDQHADAAFEPKQLADLCELIVDCEHKTAPTQETGYPSIRTPNIGRGVLVLDDVNLVSEETYQAWTRRAVPQPGDLILAREAPAGNVAVIPEGLKVCLGQRTVLVRPKAGIFAPQYLAHLLLQRRSQQRLLAHSRGATVEHINMKDIRAFKISHVPSLEVQHQVIDKLADIDDQWQSMARAQTQKLQALHELKSALLFRAFNGDL
jgi:type I restriction enzyme S subunit